MKKVDMTDYKDEKIKIKISENKEELILNFDGEIDSQNPEESLLPFVNEIHTQIVKNKIKTVKLDFIKFTFMNSSGIKVLIKWINKMLKLPEESKYVIKFVLNSTITWQKTSLNMLARLSPEQIKIEAK